jgi:hypothetical protein
LAIATTAANVPATMLRLGSSRASRPAGSGRRGLVADSRYIPIDLVIQRRTPKPSRLPILIEAKSGDFTNTN